MSRYLTSAAAVLALNAAALSNWFVEELFFHPETVPETLAAAAINVAVVLAAAALLRLVLKERLATMALRAALLFVLIFVALRFTGALAWSSAGGPPLWRPALSLALAALGVALIPEAFWLRATRTVIAASLAFAFAPTLWTAFRAPTVEWLPLKTAAASPNAAAAPGNRVILLLDELGDDAAAPIVEALQAAGLQVAHKPLRPAGQNTFNVVPAMFTGLDFSEAKACGPSSVCSGANVLHFPNIRAARPDIDVVGLFLPYCKIQGLRSCLRKALPSDYPTAYERLANVYTSRLSRPLRHAVDEADLKRRQGAALVEEQLRAVDAAPFWEQGGVLYAHIALPHPPGSGAQADLDADYAGNLARAATLVNKLAKRMQARFADDFSITIYSDHPLRDWCVSRLYKPTACKVRPTFKSENVPLILAGPKTQTLPPIDNNIDVFKTL